MVLVEPRITIVIDYTEQHQELSPTEMDCSPEPEPKRHCLEDSWEDMDDDSLVETFDVATSEAERRWSTYFFFEKLLSFSARNCEEESSLCSEACRYYRDMNDPRTAHARRRPKVDITKFVSDHDDQVVSYLSLNSNASPEDLASAYDLLEAAWFETFPFSAVQKKGPRLEYFRMAQRIRDEYGITRSNSSYPCFNSFADIKRLEERLDEDDPVDFMLQCIALAGGVTVGGMYDCVKTIPQLMYFHKEVSRLGRADESCEYMFEERFETLVEEDSQTPLWCHLERFLEQSSTFPCGLRPVLNLAVPSIRLDVAFRKVTDYIIRCFAHMTMTCIFDYNTDWEITPEDVTSAVEALKPLINRGARLDYREPHDFLHYEQSSLGALIELSDLVSIFPIEDFFPHICCPLARRGNELKFDDLRPARLSCLAARNIKTIDKRWELPRRFVSMIRMHQDLRAKLRNPFLRIAVTKRRVCGKAVLIDDTEIRALTAFARKIDWALRPLDDSDSDGGYY